MAKNQKTYDSAFKAQAVKLAQEIGGHKAAKELGIPKGTIYTWTKAFKEGRLRANEAVHTPNNALSLNDGLIGLRKQVEEQELVRGKIWQESQAMRLTYSKNNIDILVCSFNYVPSMNSMLFMIRSR